MDHANSVLPPSTVSTQTDLPLSTSDTSSDLAQRFEQLKEAVLCKRPILREILQKQGTKNLYEYAKHYISVNLNPPIQQRQNEFLDTFRSEVDRCLGPTVAEEATRQLAEHYYVSTADHHGPICHPFFLNSNLVSSAPYFEQEDPTLKYVIVLPCASISFDNSSFPRGLVFHSAKNPNKMLQFGFFPRNSRPCPVFNYRSYTASDIDRAKKMLADAVVEEQVLPSEAATVNSLIDEIYLKPEVLACTTFSDQVTKTNYDLWKRFFRNQAGAPGLIYLEQESFVARLILNYHIDADTTINHILFDRSYDAMITSYFDGIMGAFSQKDGWGTYLFWALPKGQKYRVQLLKEENELVTPDGSFRLPLTPEAVRQALEDHEIFPSTMLDFMVLSFYYGLKCLGGFSQVNYLTYMKNAYIKMQVDRGNYRSIEVCARAQTKELGGDLTIAFLKNAMGELTPATGLDLILHGNDQTWPELFEESKHITLEEALNPTMPDFYKIIYSESERDPALTSITPEDIARLTHLDKKIRPCGTI